MDQIILTKIQFTSDVREVAIEITEQQFTLRGFDEKTQLVACVIVPKRLLLKDGQ
jgi:hypothetical protein